MDVVLLEPAGAGGTATSLAVAALANVAPGSAHLLSVGGRGSRLDPGPVNIEATLVSRGGGRFELEDRHSHLASMCGRHFDMGPCAVVRTGGVTLLLTSRKPPPFDLGQLRSQGIEPREFAVIGVKAAVAHRRTYDPIAAASHLVDTPGPCRSELAGFAWRRLRRPIHPLDPIEHPDIEVAWDSHLPVSLLFAGIRASPAELTPPVAQSAAFPDYTFNTSSVAGSNRCACATSISSATGWPAA